MFGQVKQFVVSNPISEMVPPRPQPNTYTINSKRGKWWQRKLYEIAWKLMIKYGNVEQVHSLPEYSLSYSRVVIDFDYIEELIYQHEHCLKAAYNREIEYIVIGRDVMSAMNRNVSGFNPFSTQFPSDFKSHTKYRGQLVTFNGTRIKVAPYFEGFVAVLKD